MEFGICPVTTDALSNGVHGGVNGGRWCWVVKGMLCENEGLEPLREQVMACGRCEFFRVLQFEEGSGLMECVEGGQVLVLN